MKVVGSLPIFLDAPLWVDVADGVYAFPDSTGVDEDSVLATAGNYTVRKNIVEARVLFQFMF